MIETYHPWLVIRRILKLINDGFQVAYLVMHSAFDELKIAYDLHTSKNQDERYFKRLFASILLFQSGMESIIYWISTEDDYISNKGSFIDKWENALKTKEISFDFSDYSKFYREIRIPISHPDKGSKIDKINNIKFINVYNGIRCGWDAFEALSEAVGFSHDKDSWSTMCRSHGIPAVL